MSLAWTDNPGGSRRSDGARVGEFILDGRPQWWAYTADWRPRGNVEALGPFNSRQEAKDALSSCLSIPA